MKILRESSENLLLWKNRDQDGNQNKHRLERCTRQRVPSHLIVEAGDGLGIKSVSSHLFTDIVFYSTLESISYSQPL